MIRLVFIIFVVSAAGYLGFGEEASIQEQLATSREQIDKIDRQIVNLLNQRATVVKKVGKIKAAAGLPVKVPSREQEVLNKIAEIGARGPLPAARLKNIYSTLLEQMRDWEEEQ